MSVSHNVRDQISSCFLHTRSAQQITQRTLPNPLPSSRQQAHFSQSKPLPSYLPWQLPQRRSSASAHAILFCVVQCAFTFIPSCLYCNIEGGTVFQTNFLTNKVLLISQVLIGWIIRLLRKWMIKLNGTHIQNISAAFRIHKHLGAERKDVSPHPASWR